MIMALVAVNKNGTEVIADNLVRGYYTSKGSLVLEGDYFNMDNSKYTNWIAPYYNPDEGVEDISVEIPKGTIEKLTSRKLTWDDKPVELI